MTRLAAPRESRRPAPWAAEPKLSRIAVSVPTSSQLSLPMSPGTITGWPVSRKTGGRSGCPGPKARVAPLRCTHSCVGTPSTSCVSSLAMLCATS